MRKYEKPELKCLSVLAKTPLSSFNAFETFNPSFVTTYEITSTGSVSKWDEEV